MPRTEIKSHQIKDAEVKRADLNVSTAGSAVITKVIAGTNLTISSTGADAGTGDVTVNLNSNPDLTTLKVGGQTIIDSSRNLGNVISISTIGNITQTGTNLTVVMNNTTATNNSHYAIQRSSVLKGLLGVSFVNNGLVNGSVPDDLCIRSVQKVIISADNGSNAHLVITPGGVNIKTTNLQIDGVNGYTGTFLSYDPNNNQTLQIEITKGIITNVTIL